MTIISSFIVPHPPLILPEIGKGREKEIQATINAYQMIADMICDLKPDTIFIVSPHAPCYSDYFRVASGAEGAGDFSNFGCPQVRLSAKYDDEFVSELERIAKAEDVPAGTLGHRNVPLDHATLVPLYFIQQVFPDARIVSSGFSGLDPEAHYHYGQCIAQTSVKLDRKTVFVASGDLSHRLIDNGRRTYAPEGPLFDSKVTSAMAEGDFQTFFGFEPAFWEAAGDCGLRSFQVMAGALHGKALTSSLLSYEGPFGVGYAVAAFDIREDDPKCNYIKAYQEEQARRLEARKASEDEYISLARLTLETYIREFRLVEIPLNLPEDLTKRRAGVFVTLTIRGELRGCIGTLGPSRSCVADEIRHLTISAGTNDHRFPPVTARELPLLEYKVSVVGPPEPLPSIEGHDFNKYGIIVTTPGKRGVLLPCVPGVTCAEEQRNVAMQKGGIRSDENYKMERFHVEPHEATTYARIG